MRESDARKWTHDLYVERINIWNAAKSLAETALKEIARSALADGGDERIDEGRIIIRSRLKQQDRFLGKLHRKCADLPNAQHPRNALACELLVGDVIGMRAECKTKRDVSLFVEALDRASAAGEIRRTQVKDFRAGGIPGPKPSGYRAYHSDLLQGVVVDGAPVDVCFELQVKTHLQLSWGELTHEDLYKPDAVLVSPTKFHQMVGRSMADMLDAVDELADQLAQDLSQQSRGPSQDSETGRGGPTQQARIIVAKPRYALGLVNGKRGLIPALRVKELLESDKKIDVDDYVHVGDHLTVQTILEGGNLFLYPVDKQELLRHT